MMVIGVNMALIGDGFLILSDFREFLYELLWMFSSLLVMKLFFKCLYPSDILPFFL